MSNSDSDYLNSEDINEEFSVHDDSETENGMNADNFGAEDEISNYGDELEYEDVGEPSTFNFNIHNGTYM